MATASDNLALWRSVEKTDPAHTKKVNQRGGFTAIGAHYQIMRATEVFGPVGIGWGYDVGEPIWHDALVIVPVSLWHGTREQSFGPIYGGAEWKSDKGRLDSDAPKKATTDGLTKALSQLGFNADVFLGRFDDNKYVQDVAREFAAAVEGAAKGMPEAEFSRLQSLLKGAGVSPATLLKEYGVTDLRLLDQGQYRDAIARLNTRMAAKAKAETNAAAPAETFGELIDDEIPY